jgi:hypothetical protein
MRTCRVAAGAACLAIALLYRSAAAHHEALFGPQSSLAVESDGFVSTQMHVKVIGTGASYDRESVFIVSGGVSLFRAVPWTLTLVQPLTYEAAHTPTASSVGPLAMCDCFARENLIVANSYRFDFESLRHAWQNDGNFALFSAAFELPTGNKEAEPLHGPSNYILAGMLGFGWRAVAAVALGYYRINSADASGSKKGNNALAGLGLTYTPIDARGRMISVQLGIAAEVHERDVSDGTTVDASGGWELFASPTVVWEPATRLRFFTYVSVPFAQRYRSETQEDRWRAGLGLIYSFERAAHAKVVGDARM